MDFSFLRAEPFELPDPQALAIRGMTLANLSQQNQEGQMKLDALRQAQDVKQAAAKVFGDAQTMGWDAAIKKAAQEGNTLGAAAALQLRRQDEGDAAKIENDRAQANERNSAATKNAMAAKVDGFKQFATIITGVASGQVPVSDRAMSAAYESARAILPDNVVRTMPADPAQFKQWATQFADPETLTKIWEKQQTVPATVAKDYATAGKANAEVQYMPREVAAKEVSARAAATSAGAAVQNAQTNRMQYENPNMQHTQDANGNPIAFNPRGGAFSPGTDAQGNPLPVSGGKLTDKAKGEVADLRAEAAVIDDAIAAVKKTPSAFGFVRGLATNSGTMAESLAGRGDSPAERQARSMVFNNVSSVIKQRAGTAQSLQELQRINAFLPGHNDNAQQIIDKFNAYKQYIASRERVYTQPVTAGSSTTGKTVKWSDLP